MQPFTFDDLAARSLTKPLSGGDQSADGARQAAMAEAERFATLAAAREEGYGVGLAEARERLERAVEALAGAAGGVEAALEEFYVVAERRAVELALVLAEKIVGESLALDPSLVLANVTGALRAAAERDQLVVEVNPDDLEAVREATSDLLSRVGGVHKLEIVPERRVPRGGCVVRTLEGEVDARISEKLLLARELLTEAAGEAL
jgi:flagellar assembly protein FliH